MEEGFDVDAIFDALNLTGQYQPSSTFGATDPSLNTQILDNFFLSVDDAQPPPILNAIDDLNAALFHPTTDSFTNDDIDNLLSTPIGELPRQSTIEDSMDNMTLQHSNTENLASSLCIPMGSSPVEQKEIDNSILVQQYVQQQNRIQRNAKARKSTGYHPSSSTVGPIDVLSSYGGCQPCPTGQIQDNFDYSQQIIQFDSIDSLKIKILCHPRPTFRPRTQNESKLASHYIRSAASSPFGYPTIAIPQIWALQSVKNIIEVTLCALDKLPHDYAIDNKNCHATYDDEALIFRQNESHTLYFCLTNEDIKNGHKSFMIEYIKSKQDEKITKELIRKRQLEHSFLRFTRIYQSDKNTFQRDENSVEYSNVMTEGYGDIGVEHMGPKFGPMAGNERIYALLKGRFAKEDISVLVREETTGWQQQMSITKNGNLVFFTMPAFPFSQVTRAETNITIFYKGEELEQSIFVYKGELDQELANLNLNDSPATASASSSTFDPLDFFAATGVCPVSHSSRKSTAKRTTKRLSPNKKLSNDQTQSG